MYRHAAWLLIMTLSGLGGCSAGTSDLPQPAAGGASVSDTGARMYSGSCIACHQQDARGIPGVYPSLVGSPVLLGNPQELARWVIQGRRPPSMPAGRYPTVMTQFGWMQEQDAAALFTYLRSHFGNAGPPVDAATVAQALGR
jgi:mono/diheme cytochrome c family protein